MDKKLLYENEYGMFYTNGMCELMTEYCERRVNDFPPLENHKVYLCETYTGEVAYILFDDKGEPIAASFCVEDMGTKIEVLRLARKGDE